MCSIYRAFANFKPNVTAVPFKEGKEPGNPLQICQVFSFGNGSGNRLQEQKSLVLRKLS